MYGENCHFSNFIPKRMKLEIFFNFPMNDDGYLHHSMQLDQMVFRFLFVCIFYDSTSNYFKNCKLIGLVIFFWFKVLTPNHNQQLSFLL